MIGNPLLSVFRGFQGCRHYAAAVLLPVAMLWLVPGEAQFGFNLPRDDFTWVWGDGPEGARRGISDFSARGGESGFRCTLSGGLRASSRMSLSDIRQMENELQVSAFFIQTVANTMNTLDLRRELDWAELDCERPEQSEDAEARQERLDKAREKMIREQRERRERQQED